MVSPARKVGPVGIAKKRSIACGDPLRAVFPVSDGARCGMRGVHRIDGGYSITG
jgi:hypothetical protein